MFVPTAGNMTMTNKSVKRTKGADEMETFRRGKRKKHIGCGGTVRFVENVDPAAHWEWDMECLSCGHLVKEEHVILTDGDE